MQRGVSGAGGDRTPARPCPRCGAPLRSSHREYKGRGESATVLLCVACGHTVSRPARSDSERAVRNRTSSSKHPPLDEGPPSNPVIDPDLAARLLEELGP